MVYFVGPFSEAKLLVVSGSVVYKFGSPSQDASHHQDEIPESQLPKPNKNLKPQTSTASETLGGGYASQRPSVTSSCFACFWVEDFWIPNLNWTWLSSEKHSVTVTRWRIPLPARTVQRCGEIFPNSKHAVLRFPTRILWDKFMWIPKNHGISSHWRGLDIPNPCEKHIQTPLKSQNVTRDS